MLFRLILLILVATGGVALWRVLRGDPRRALPAGVAGGAARSTWLAEAADLRQKIAARALAAGGEGLLADVDEVLRRLVEIERVEHDATTAGEAMRARLAGALSKLAAERESALAWLAEAFAVLAEAAAHEMEGSVAELAVGLRTQKEELALEVEARREVNALLQRG